jgi:hypothetical protein
MHTPLRSFHNPSRSSEWAACHPLAIEMLPSHASDASTKRRQSCRALERAHMAFGDPETQSQLSYVAISHLVGKRRSLRYLVMHSVEERPRMMPGRVTLWVATKPDPSVGTTMRASDWRRMGMGQNASANSSPNHRQTLVPTLMLVAFDGLPCPCRGASTSGALTIGRGG